MPRAGIATTQAKFALEKLHAELGGKIKDNKREAARLGEPTTPLFCGIMAQTPQAAVLPQSHISGGDLKCVQCGHWS
jgi:hypothetical protein